MKFVLHMGHNMTCRSLFFCIIIVFSLIAAAGCGISDQTEVERQDEEPAAAAGELLASLPDKEISLHARGDDGVLLQIGEHRETYNWEYMTPRGIYPELAVRDYDGDGNDELALSLYVGSGTGVSITQLRMVEWDETGVTADHLFEEDDYLARLKEAVQFTAGGKDGVVQAEIVVDGMRQSFVIDEYDPEELGEISDQLWFGSIVHFDFDRNEEDRITASFGAGMLPANFGIPAHIGNIVAEVRYEDGVFSLRQMRFEENE